MDKCPYNKLIKISNHPKAHKGFVRDYIIKAEKALGKYLPNNACVHHYTKDQLVICQDHAYHKLLHSREESLKNCGNASWRKCYICKKYDDPVNLISFERKERRNGNRSPYHKDCLSEYIKNNREKWNEYKRRWRNKNK